MLTDRERNTYRVEIEMKWMKLEEKWRAERRGINVTNRSMQTNRGDNSEAETSSYRDQQVS